VYHDTAIYCKIQSSVNLLIFSDFLKEIVAELNNSQPQCTTTALIRYKSIHFGDNTSIYHDIRYVYIRPKYVSIYYHYLMYHDMTIYHCISIIATILYLIGFGWIARVFVSCFT